MSNYSNFQPVQDMSDVLKVFREIFDGKKTYGTDNIRMGFFHDFPLVAKVKENTISFALPFDGPTSMLVAILTKRHYNKSNSIVCECYTDENNTLVLATFFLREYKLFMEL